MSIDESGVHGKPLHEWLADQAARGNLTTVASALCALLPASAALTALRVSSGLSPVDRAKLITLLDTKAHEQERRAP